MKLRPTNKDRKAIDKLKLHYMEATSSKAIFRAVYDVPVLSKKIDDLHQQIQHLNHMLDRVSTAHHQLIAGMREVQQLSKDMKKS